MKCTQRRKSQAYLQRNSRIHSAVFIHWNGSNPHIIIDCICRQEAPYCQHGATLYHNWFPVYVRQRLRTFCNGRNGDRYICLMLLDLICQNQNTAKLAIFFILFNHNQALTRRLNSPVRVSISILSPISQKAATGNSIPELILAGFITLPEVSPRMAGSV